MSTAKAIEVVGRWPGDRSAPRRLSELMAQAKGTEKQQIGQLVEALIVAAETQADQELIDKYFAD